LFLCTLPCHAPFLKSASNAVPPMYAVKVKESPWFHRSGCPAIYVAERQTGADYKGQAAHSVLIIRDKIGRPYSAGNIAPRSEQSGSTVAFNGSDLGCCQSLKIVIVVYEKRRPAGTHRATNLLAYIPGTSSKVSPTPVTKGIRRQNKGPRPFPLTPSRTRNKRYSKKCYPFSPS
jgi:hypothetical protein